MCTGATVYHLACHQDPGVGSKGLLLTAFHADTELIGDTLGGQLLAHHQDCSGLGARAPSQQIVVVAGLLVAYLAQLKALR